MAGDPARRARREAGQTRLTALLHHGPAARAGPAAATRGQDPNPLGDQALAGVERGGLPSASVTSTVPIIEHLSAHRSPAANAKLGNLGCGERLFPRRV